MEYAQEIEEVEFCLNVYEPTEYKNEIKNFTEGVKYPVFARTLDEKIVTFNDLGEQVLIRERFFVPPMIDLSDLRKKIPNEEWIESINKMLSPQEEILAGLQSKDFCINKIFTSLNKEMAIKIIEGKLYINHSRTKFTLEDLSKAFEALQILTSTKTAEKILKKIISDKVKRLY